VANNHPGDIKDVGANSLNFWLYLMPRVRGQHGTKDQIARNCPGQKVEASPEVPAALQSVLRAGQPDDLMLMFYTLHPSDIGVHDQLRRLSPEMGLSFFKGKYADK
jgi:hypothetical protein